MATALGNGAPSPDTRHLSGFGQLVVGQLLARAMTFVALAYLARVLGVVMFGAVGFSAAVAAYFQLLVDAGLDLIGMREIARRDLSVETVVSGILAARLCLTGIAAALLWAAASLFEPSPEVRAIIVAYSLTFLSFTCNLKWVFQALERNDLVSATIVLSQALYLAGVLMFIKGPADAFRVPVLFFGSELIGCTILFACYRRQGYALRLPGVRHVSWSLLKEAFPLAGARGLRTLTVNFDLLLLGLVGTPLAVGLYTAVSRIILFLRELGEMYYLPLFPLLTRAAREGGAGLVEVGRGGLRYAAVVIFPLAIGGCLTGPQLLAFTFGREYAPGAPALCLLLTAMVLVMLTGAYRSTLVARGEQGSLLRIVAVGTALNVGMNLVLIPRYSIAGAAASALATETLVFILSLKVVDRSVPLSPWAPIARPALAAAGMGMILWALPAWPFLFRVGIAAVSYAALIVWTGAVRPREVIGAWPGHRSLAPAPPQRARAKS